MLEESETSLRDRLRIDTVASRLLPACVNIMLAANLIYEHVTGVAIFQVGGKKSSTSR